MKHIKLLGLLLIIFTGISCQKTSKTIDYPQSGFFGKNILSLPNESVVDADIDNSMAAVLGDKASLKLRFTNLSVSDNALSSLPIWGYGQETGWFSTQYDDNGGTQSFEASLTGKIDLQILFMRWGNSNPGRCRIEFLENSTTVTKTIYLNW